MTSVAVDEVSSTPQFREFATQYQMVESIRAKADVDSNTFTVNRKRLIKSGIATAPSYGHLELTLPRFEQFIYRQ